MDATAIGRSLVAALSTVPDPRSAQGRRHPLPAILALATAAMLSGARSLYAIAQWGRCQPVEVLTALGFTHTPTPAVSTLHLVFKQVDAQAVEAALAAWANAVLGEATASVAVDGKALRGTYQEAIPGLEVVAAYATEAGLVLAQAGGSGQRPGGRTDRRGTAAGRPPLGRPGRHGGCALLSAGALHADPGGGRGLRRAGQGQSADPLG